MSVPNRSNGKQWLLAATSAAAGTACLLLAGPAQAELSGKALSYTLKRGDRIVHLARRFGLEADAILEANDIENAKTLREGQTIVIPAEKTKAESVSPAGREASTSPRPPRATKQEPLWQQRAKALAKQLGLGSRRVANLLMLGQIDPALVRAAGGSRPPRFLRFPVAGGIAGRGWGSGAGGYHLAFDIPGKTGARVSAAAPGIVAYAGDEMAGFGKVVLIVHPGGLVTLYAHNSELKTLPGERVKRGTRVALLGSTGFARGPHVHFELIHQGRLCDPAPLMRPVPETAAGRPILGSKSLINWPRSGGRPKGLRCARRRRHPAYVGLPRGTKLDTNIDGSFRVPLGHPAPEVADAPVSPARPVNSATSPAPEPPPSLLSTPAVDTSP